MFGGGDAPGKCSLNTLKYGIMTSQRKPNFLKYGKIDNPNVFLVPKMYILHNFRSEGSVVIHFESWTILGKIGPKPKNTGL